MNHGYDSYKDIKETLQSMLDKGYTIAMIETVIEQNFNKEAHNGDHNKLVMRSAE